MATKVTVTNFVPKFREDLKVYDGTGQSSPQPVNKYYFADKDTAQFIADNYGDGQVYEEPFTQGPFYVPANMYTVRIKNTEGVFVNAGFLAGYYDRNPNSSFPGLADKLIKKQLNQDYGTDF